MPSNKSLHPTLDPVRLALPLQAASVNCGRVAEAVAKVREVSFYHGGDVLYSLDGVPGIWHEECLAQASLEAAQ